MIKKLSVNPGIFKRSAIVAGLWVKKLSILIMYFKFVDHFSNFPGSIFQYKLNIYKHQSHNLYILNRDLFRLSLIVPVARFDSFVSGAFQTFVISIPHKKLS